MTIVENVRKTEFDFVHERGGITFHPLACPSLYRIFSSGIEKVVGVNYGLMIIMYSDNKTIVYQSTKGIKDVSRRALSKLKKDPRIMKRFMEILGRKTDKFISWLRGIDLNATDEELIDYYQKYVEIYFDCCLYGEPYPFAVKDVLDVYLEEVLEKKGVTDFSDKVLTLITPTELSFINREEMMLNRIISKIKSRYLELFKLDVEDILSKLDDYPDLKNMIVKHRDEYYWVAYDYVGETWEIGDFVKRIKESLDKELKTAEEEFLRDIKNRQKKLFSELSFAEKQLFLAAQDASLLLDLKKEKFTQVHYYINKLIKEIAKRKNVDFWNLIFLMESELDDFMAGNIKEEELESRRRKSVYVMQDYKIECIRGKVVDELISRFSRKNIKYESQINGKCACQGRVIGRIRVLNSLKESTNVKKGEIIVMGMTTPEYIFAMKKAAAIVTDEGGLTCHAAIISRELGIPCVIATKVATKVFKDGDMVLVDADNGKVMKK